MRSYRGTNLNVALLLFIIISCFLVSAEDVSEEKEIEICSTGPCCTAAVRLLEWMNPVTDPCQDFYEYSCGGVSWKTDEISKQRPSDKVEKELRTILHEKPEPDEARPYRLLRKFYFLCLDSNITDSDEEDPAVKMLRAAGGWPILEKDWSEKNWNLLETEIYLKKHRLGGGLFDVFVDVDMKDRTKHSIIIDQPTLGWAREELIEGTDNPSVRAYFDDLYNVAQKFGADKNAVNKSLEESLEFERALALLTRSKRERRDWKSLHNRYSLSRLQKEMPWLNWKRLIRGVVPASAALQEDEEIIVKEPGYLSQVPLLMEEYPKKTIANYVMTRAARSLRQHPPPGKPKWKHCVEAVTRSSFGLALASLYAKKYFDERTNQTAMDMTRDIQKELLKDMHEIKWMDDITKKRAMLKISKIDFLIGFPKELLDTNEIEYFYKEFNMTTTNFYEAMVYSSKWLEYTYMCRFGRPVRWNDWRYLVDSYFDINAYYTPWKNSVHITGPIIHRSPLFHAQSPMYVNFGDLGTTIGHELLHAVDNDGSQFNEDGEFENWWDDETYDMFMEKKQCLIDQYSSFNETRHTKLMVNGTLTQGENIADNGALELAYNAYRRTSKRLGVPEPLLPGLQHLSRGQLFMLSAANFYCFISDVEFMKFVIKHDPHTPDEYRVKGVVMNSPEFSRLFKCSQGDPMNPPEKCEVW